MRMWGVLLLVAWALPIPPSPWEPAWRRLESRPGPVAPWLPILCALALLFGARLRSARARGWVSVVGALVLVGIWLPLGDLVVGRTDAPVAGPAFVFSLLVLCPCLVAAGNRVHRRRRSADTAALVGAYGGFGVWAACLVPLVPDYFGGDARSLLSGVVFEAYAWREPWPIPVALCALLLYATLAVGLLLRPGYDSRLGSALSRFARILRWGVPVAFLLALVFTDGPQALAILIVEKGLLLVSCVQTVFAVGLARLLEGEPEPPIEAQVFD
jgi:hypothetical protein